MRYANTWSEIVQYAQEAVRYSVGEVGEEFEVTVCREPHLWDAYAAHHDCALYAHSYDWAVVLGEAYRLPVYHLALTDRRSNRVAGILPLIHFHPPGKADRLISLPYTDATGILCDDEYCCRLLVQGALCLAEDLEADHLELRQLGAQPLGAAEKKIRAGWHHETFDFKTGLQRRLPRSSRELWSGFKPKVRNQVRKARNSGCVVVRGGKELLGEFYAVFSKNMRDLGSPVHSPELFTLLINRMAENITVFIVSHSEQPVATSIVVRHGQVMTNPWASSLRRFRPLCPNMLLYWSMLEFAVSTNCLVFDFGRSSPDATTCRFKLQWGAKKIPLIWHVFSKGTKSWDPRMESLEYEPWKRLELGQSRRKGPAIRRWISL